MCVSHSILGGLKRPKQLRAASPFVRVAAALDRAVDRFTLGTLRNVVANLAFVSRPASPAEAYEAIANLNKLRNKLPSSVAVAELTDPILQEAVERLVGIPNFVKLRNMVVHKAFRPTQ